MYIHHGQQWGEHGQRESERGQFVYGPGVWKVKCIKVVWRVEERESEREKEKRGGVCLGSSCSFRVVK